MDYFNRTNPFYICGKCWSIESRDRIKNHVTEEIKRKDIIPTEREKKSGITILAKLRDISLSHQKMRGEYIICLVINKKQLDCQALNVRLGNINGTSSNSILLFYFLINF